MIVENSLYNHSRFLHCVVIFNLVHLYHLLRFNLFLVFILQVLLLSLIVLIEVLLLNLCSFFSNLDGLLEPRLLLMVLSYLESMSNTHYLHQDILPYLDRNTLFLLFGLLSILEILMVLLVLTLLHFVSLVHLFSPFSFVHLHPFLLVLILVLLLMQGFRDLKHIL